VNSTWWTSQTADRISGTRARIHPGGGFRDEYEPTLGFEHHTGMRAHPAQARTTVRSTSRVEVAVAELDAVCPSAEEVELAVEKCSQVAGGDEPLASAVIRRSGRPPVARADARSRQLDLADAFPPGGPRRRRGRLSAARFPGWAAAAATATPALPGSRLPRLRASRSAVRMRAGAAGVLPLTTPTTSAIP